MSYLQQTQAFFDATAPTYERQIVQPAFAAFAQAVVQTARPNGAQAALDIGTGTGILARLLAPYVAQVVGIDLAPHMVAVGQALIQAEGWPNMRLEVANAHHLPYPDAAFDLVVASFGLNATAPSLVLPQLWRVLPPGGVLAFHEWHELHPLDEALVDVLSDYLLDDAEVAPDLFELREYLRRPRPWDNVFQTAEDYQEVLAEQGWSAIEIWEDRPVRLSFSIPDFLGYKLAWANRRAELAAMPAPQRADCLDALHSTLGHWADSEGHLTYDPLLFRVRAVKETV
jgi:ubiquinone/menaquinone biosynthesis C-methylase UbiE